MNPHTFQIVIPTVGGRESYLKGAIQSCLEQSVANVGVIVSNNGGSQTVRECVESFNSPRITYLETNAFLPMSMHWEFAIGHVTAEYFCILGDDDALMPSCVLQVIRALEKFPEEQCVVHRPAQYYWSDYLVEDLKNRYITHGGCTGSVIRRDTKSIFKQVCAFREHYGKLPFLYHGFVSTQLVRKIQKEEGVIFAKIAPDVYSDLLLAVYLNSFVEIDSPLTLGGQGARSNGANVLLNTEAGKKFYEKLPEFLIPRRPGTSLYIQLFEYIEYILDRHMKNENWEIDWMKFVLRTMQEAIISEGYSTEIINGTREILNEYCAGLQRAVLVSMVKLVEIKIIRSLLRPLLNLRSTRVRTQWPNAAVDFSATSAIEVARALDNIQRI